MEENQTTNESLMDVNDLPQALFQCLGMSDPNFGSVAYFQAFQSKPSDLSRVDFVHKDVKRYFNVFVKRPNYCKDDFVAFSYEETATENLDSGKYGRALEDYNRCIATAESDELLALAYGNRAVTLLKLKMPKKCAEDAQRALACDQAEELKDELLEIKKEAEESTVSSQGYYEEIPGIAKFQSNSSIQSANCNVRIKHDEEFGRHVVATRDINVGEIISLEQPYTCVLTSDKLIHCYYCLELCYNPIACEHCTVALFCGDFCKVKAYATYHKYECPVLPSLYELSKNNCLLLALKITILVLDDYYRSYYYTSDYDKNGCYKSNRYKEVQELRSTVSGYPKIELLQKAIQTAIVFELFSRQTNFFNCFGEDAKKKFKELLFLHLKIAGVNAVKIYEHTNSSRFSETANFGLGIYSFFSLFTHSCCANVMKTYHGTAMVLRAINSIKRGQQCFVNRYGIRYEAFAKSVRQHLFEIYGLGECKCRACQENWKPSLGNLVEICKNLGINCMGLCDIMKNFIGTDINMAHYLLPLLLKQFKKCEEYEPQGNALTLKKLIVHCYVIFGNKKN